MKKLSHSLARLVVSVCIDRFFLLYNYKSIESRTALAFIHKPIIPHWKVKNKNDELTVSLQGHSWKRCAKAHLNCIEKRTDTKVLVLQPYDCLCLSPRSKKNPHTADNRDLWLQPRAIFPQLNRNNGTHKEIIQHNLCTKCSAQTNKAEQTMPKNNCSY